MELAALQNRIEGERVESGVEMSADPSGENAADADLLRLVAEGDRAAFAELFRRRRDVVYRFALHLTGRREAAEDIVQETFLSVMRDAGRYERGRATVAAWLCGMARNCARQRLDREWRFQPLTAAEESVARAAANDDPLACLSRAEGVASLRRAILRLPLHYREVVVLCDLQEMSYAEAAAALGCAVGTVRSRLSRGRELVVRRLRASREGAAAPGRLEGARCDA
ncbi:MAG: RNA polymerase sigma factor [Vicinamibacterales bacterium]